jgi:plastocyanin
MVYGIVTHDRGTDDATEGRIAQSRRNLLKLAGAGIGLAALGGTSVVAGNQAQPQSDQEDDEDGQGSDLADDLIDPVFGYPLDADESDDVVVSNVVELLTEEGEGAHPEFPTNPQTGQAVELEFVFDPAGIRVGPDDVVKFQVVSGEHTVTAFHEKFSIPQRAVQTRIPEGSPGFTSPPIYDGEAWLYQFPEPGVYDVLCLPHLFVGMVMRVVVVDPETDDVPDAPTAGELNANAQQVLTAPELDPTNIVEAGTVGWADLTIEPPAPATETPANETMTAANETTETTTEETTTEPD